MNDPQLTTSQFMEALALWREARGGSMALKAATLAVIRNRTVDSQYRWPRSTVGVIIQPLQFSSFNPSDPNSTQWPNPVGNVAQWDAWLDCITVVQTPLTADPTEGATNYEAVDDPAGRPKWADPSKMTVTIGNTRFYKL